MVSSVVSHRECPADSQDWQACAARSTRPRPVLMACTKVGTGWERAGGRWSRIVAVCNRQVQ